MANRKFSSSGRRKLRHLVERSVRSCVRYAMVVYAMALSYRSLFAIFLVAVVGFLHVNTVLEWLAEQGPFGIRGRVPQPVASLLRQDHGGLLSVGIVLIFWSISMVARLLTRALNAVLEVEETCPPWKRAASSPIFAPDLALAAV